MDEIILGLSLAAIIIFLFKLIFGWIKYNRSIHKVIYSSYLEFYTKKNKITRLSESAAFTEDYGKHKVLFQLFASKGQKLPKPYIVIILSSGLYCLKVSNVPGEVCGKSNGAWENIVVFDKKHPEKRAKERMGNPVDELEKFSKKIREKISKIDTPIYKIAVFPDQCTLNIKGKEMGGTLIIKRSQLQETLMNIHRSGEKTLLPFEIDALWEMVAKDSLKLEGKNYG